jgi:hypothetical protein
MVRNMSCWGKNTGRNETGRAVRRHRQTDAETCLLESRHISFQDSIIHAIKVYIQAFHQTG